MTSTLMSVHHFIGIHSLNAVLENNQGLIYRLRAVSCHNWGSKFYFFNQIKSIDQVCRRVSAMAVKPCHEVTLPTVIPSRKGDARRIRMAFWSHGALLLVCCHVVMGFICRRSSARPTVKLSDMLTSTFGYISSISIRLCQNSFTSEPLEATLQTLSDHQNFAVFCGRF